MIRTGLTSKTRVHIRSRVSICGSKSYKEGYTTSRNQGFDGGKVATYLSLTIHLSTTKKYEISFHTLIMLITPNTTHVEMSALCNVAQKNIRTYRNMIFLCIDERTTRVGPI